MRRRVRLIISINFIRQVYAFGDAHSTGTSTLKKHRCMALVTTSSPLTPTSVLPSHSPSLSQSEHNAYVNFPSPSVIVSIATMRSSDSGSDAVNTIATRYMSPADRDELIRNAGVVLGSGGCVTGAAFVQLAKNLVELGAKHGTAVVEDLGVLFKSPGFEMILPGVAYEYQNHFVEEARACAGGIGVVVTVTPEPSASKLDQVVNVTLKMSYVTSSSNPLLQHAANIHSAFDAIDANKDGFLYLDELHGALGDMGVALSRARAQRLLAGMDLDGDGKVNYREFVRKVSRVAMSDVERQRYFQTLSTSTPLICLTIVNCALRRLLSSLRLRLPTPLFTAGVDDARAHSSDVRIMLVGVGSSHPRRVGFSYLFS